MPWYMSFDWFLSCLLTSLKENAFNLNKMKTEMLKNGRKRDWEECPGFKKWITGKLEGGRMGQERLRR